LNNKQGATRCPNCLEGAVQVFHTAKNVPTNSCILLASRQEALDYPRGDIALGFCDTCGFVTNTAFDPVLTEYSGRYEETQGFSPTFQRFHQDLANRLITKFGLQDRDILEIGCGKGEFLLLLCADGKNRGIGYDPGYRNDRHAPVPGQNIRFIPDFYTEKCTDTAADFVCCKMTLEHIQPTGQFVEMVRRAIGDRPDTVVFFQIPDATRIMRDCAFEDIYYEHCSYFSPCSLGRLFRDRGFEVLGMATEYEDQYLTIEAKPVAGSPTPPADDEGLAELTVFVDGFAAKLQKAASAWRKRLALHASLDHKVVLWGSGSKAVAFLSTLGVESQVAYAVDINPYRHGYFMPGSGLEIIGPESLREFRPDVVVIMNAIYRSEIGEDLQKLGLAPEILTV